MQEIICHLQGVLGDYINEVIELRQRQRRNRRRFQKNRIDLPTKPIVVKGNLFASTENYMKIWPQKRQVAVQKKSGINIKSKRLDTKLVEF